MKLQQNWIFIIIITIVIIVFVHDHDSIERIDCYKIDPGSKCQVPQKPYVLIWVSGQQLCTQENTEYILCLFLRPDYSLLDHSRLHSIFCGLFLSVRWIHWDFTADKNPVFLNPVIHLQDWRQLLSPVSDCIVSGSCTNWVFAAPEQGCLNFHYGYL